MNARSLPPITSSPDDLMELTVAELYRLYAHRIDRLDYFIAERAPIEIAERQAELCRQSGVALAVKSGKQRRAA